MRISPRCARSMCGLRNQAVRQNADRFPADDGQTLLARLSFTHFVELIAIDDDTKRAFYEAECTRGNWSVRELKRQVLVRQSLEVALRTYWSLKAFGVEECSTRAQLLCLRPYLGDEPFARRAGLAWAALSRAAHFHPYELPPTRDELSTWCETVRELIDETEGSWLYRSTT